ncbi:putative phosphothreonine lyase domain-containg protein [Streptomyces sp. NPDC001816]|uniref:putative phosphothreonine lyase domain-containing protein n=1 Tax=Streptomyces sp. NPDC001816 TaxID=3364612 RepID=UPI0036BA8FA3
MRKEPTQTGQPSATPPPSADTHNRWQWAMAPEVNFLAPAAAMEYANAGKWLWFLPVRALDTGWHLIKTAVEAGQLGPGAKVATLGSDFDGDPTRRPVIIYTADHRDRKDVQRVLHVLRSLGIRDALAYKADETTRSGEYGDGTAIYTSPTNTTKLNERNPAQITGRASASRGRNTSHQYVLKRPKRAAS